MAPPLLATNKSVFYMDIIYRGSNEKPYGWSAVDRLYSNWGYAWDCMSMRIDNSTINRDNSYVTFWYKRCLCWYIVLFNHCIFLHELTLLLFSRSTVYRHIFTIIIAIHSTINYVHIFDMRIINLHQWINFLIGYTNIHGHESTINTQQIGT